MTLNDLSNYAVRVSNDKYSVKIDDEYRILLPPPPSSGLVVSYILKIMRGI
jgi:gamma-glutamyltranspeptidase